MNIPHVLRAVLAVTGLCLFAASLHVPVEAQEAPPVVPVKDNNDAMRGIAPPKAPVFPKMAPKKGFARGAVRDASGKPIAGARIVLQSSAAGGFRTDAKGKTNAQGIYEIPLPVGICEIVNADCIVRYNDRAYLLPLYPADGSLDQFNSAEGAVENFTLRTYGPGSDETELNPSHGSGYFGGSIRLVWFHDSVPEGGAFEVTLTPEGPLMGGVPARTLVFRVAQQGFGGETYLNDIPIGRYRMRVAHVNGGSKSPLQVRPVFGESEHAPELLVDFEPSGSTLASLGRSGVKQLDVQFKK